MLERFDERLARVRPTLSAAERRVADAIAQDRQHAILGSAVQIAELGRVSDATLLRTVRALGYDSLADLRASLLSDLTAAAPSRRMQATLAEAGAGPAQALEHILRAQHRTLEHLGAPRFAAAFGAAVDHMAAGRVRHIFGIGPSGALADYAALQLARIGLRSRALTVTGAALADRLIDMDEGDVVAVIAYAPLYREVRAVLSRAESLGVPVVLISDSLGAVVGERVACTLPVPRGRIDHLALHGGTLAVVEALVLALAARSPEQALDALDEFAALRAGIDPDWRKRGMRRPRRGGRPQDTTAQEDPA